MPLPICGEKVGLKTQKKSPSRREPRGGFSHSHSIPMLAFLRRWEDAFCRLHQAVWCRMFVTYWNKLCMCFFAEKENARRIPVKPLTLGPRVTIVKDISL